MRIQSIAGYIRRNRFPFLVLSVLLIALIWLFRRYIFFTHAFIFPDAGGDTLTLFYPMRLAESRAIAEGTDSSWSFSRGIGIYSGSPFIALNPFQLLDYIFVNYPAYGIGISQFLRVFLAGVIAFFYFRLLKLHPFVCAVGVVLLTFSGYLIVGSTWYGHAGRFLYTIFAIFALELLLQKNIWWVLPVALYFMVGPTGLFAMEFFVVYILLRLAHTHSLNWSSLINLARRLVKPALITLLLVSPKIISQFARLRYSPRVGGEASLGNKLSSTPTFALENPDHYETVLYRFFNNDLIGLADQFAGWRNYLEAPLFYCGLASLLLVPQLFKFLKGKQFWILMGVLTLWLFIIVFPYFRYAFYFFVGDYYKSALSIFIPFTVVYFALHAMDQVLQGRKFNLYLLGGSLIVLLYFLFFYSGILTNNLDQEIRIACGGFLVTIAVLLGLLNIPKWRTITLTLLGLVIFAEALYFSNISLNRRDALPASTLKARTGHNDFTLEAVDYLESQDDSFFRMEKTFGSVKFGYNDSAAQGYFGTKSYSSHNHMNYVKFLGYMEFIDPGNEIFTRWIMGLVKAVDLHPLFSIKYMLSDLQTDGEVDRSIYELMGNVANLNIYRNKYHLPLGLAYQYYVPESSSLDIGGYLPKIKLLYRSVILKDDMIQDFPGIRPADIDLMSPGFDMASEWEARNSKTMKMIDFKEDHMKGEVDLDQPHIVFYSFPFDKGWNAKIDGRRSELFEVNHGLTGLYVPAGQHKIELYYKPKYSDFFHIISWVSLIAFLGIVIRSRRGEGTPVIGQAKDSPAGTPASLEKKESSIAGKKSTTTKKRKTKNRKKKK